MITVKNLSFNYKSYNGVVEVFRDLSIEISDETFITLIGKSGSGKSTFLKLISGLLKPTSGNIYIDGEDLWAMSGSNRLQFITKRIAHIYQDFRLIPDMSNLDNITLPSVIRKEKIDLGYLDYIIDMLDIKDLLCRFPSQVSGGQQQRVCVARALVMKPSIVLADEPTGNLDSDTSSKLIQLILDVHNRTRQTFVIATHDSDIASVAKQILVVKERTVCREIL